jgi:hypothetical protein
LRPPAPRNFDAVDALSLKPSEEWLQAINGVLRSKDVPPRQRPFKAWVAYADQHGLSLSFDDPMTRRIFEWFRANAQEGSLNIGTLFKGAYFFDACFWVLEIPVFYGTVELEPWTFLPSLPTSLKSAVARDRTALAGLINVSISALDYALSFDDLLKTPASNPFALGMLVGADRELRASGELLLTARPSAKSAHSAALAVEMFGKYLLAVRAGLNDRGAKTLGHNLEAILAQCGNVSPVRELNVLIGRAKLLPNINDRYSDAEPPARYLWEAYLTALLVAAGLVRTLTHRDAAGAMKVDGRSIGT